MLSLIEGRVAEEFRTHCPLPLTLSGDQMLDIVARILPAAATVAFASLSTFNVGYFWDIGLHFLGIVDLNNIVYSFGLTFFLWMVLVFVGLKWVDIFSEPMSETSIRRSMRTSKFVMWIGGILFALGLAPFEGWADEIVRYGVALVGLILLWGAWSVRSFLDYKTSGIAKQHDLAFLVLVPFVIFFYTGKFVAAWQRSQDDTYTITTINSASIENARLLRTSSAGVILLAEERILFIPQSQIAQIKSTPFLITKPASGPCPSGYTELEKSYCLRSGH
jgi:hypothetical protein